MGARFNQATRLEPAGGCAFSSCRLGSPVTEHRGRSVPAPPRGLANRTTPGRGVPAPRHARGVRILHRITARLGNHGPCPAMALGVRPKPPHVRETVVPAPPRPRACGPNLRVPRDCGLLPRHDPGPRIEPRCEHRPLRRRSRGKHRTAPGTMVCATPRPRACGLLKHPFLRKGPVRCIARPLPCASRPSKGDKVDRRSRRRASPQQDNRRLGRFQPTAHLKVCPVTRLGRLPSRARTWNRRRSRADATGRLQTLPRHGLADLRGGRGVWRGGGGRWSAARDFALLRAAFALQASGVSHARRRRGCRERQGGVASHRTRSQEGLRNGERGPLNGQDCGRRARRTAGRKAQGDARCHWCFREKRVSQ
jgi:hypothetical protein